MRCPLWLGGFLNNAPVPATEVWNRQETIVTCVSRLFYSKVKDLLKLPTTVQSFVQYQNHGYCRQIRPDHSSFTISFSFFFSYNIQLNIKRKFVRRNARVCLSVNIHQQQESEANLFTRFNYEETPYPSKQASPTFTNLLLCSFTPPSHYHLPPPSNNNNNKEILQLARAIPLNK